MPAKRRNAGKVVLVGDSRAGKSCLLRSFAQEAFEPTYKPTVGVDFKTVLLDNPSPAKITVWDAGGEKQHYQAIQSTYYKNARVALIVFDLTDSASFSSAQRWLAEVTAHCTEGTSVALVGTKADLWCAAAPHLDSPETNCSWAQGGSSSCGSRCNSLGCSTDVRHELRVGV